jgi:alpha-1,3-rhamnosyl/mannosyltransferase
MADVTALHAARRECGVETDRPMVLAFGGIDPRKNTRRILQAWQSMGNERRCGAVLVVIGMQEPLLGQLGADFRELVQSGECRLVGYVGEEHFAALLGGCEVLCYPSLSEGFGLPVLDAFASRTAVLTSRVTSIPEVAGDAAHYVEPYCVESIASGLAVLLQDDDLRGELIEKGSDRVRDFSWERCASIFAQVLEDSV